MDRAEYLPAEPRCVLCLTCTNSGFDACSAGIEQYGVRFACDSYVRLFTGRGFRHGAESPSRKKPRPLAG